MNKIVKTAFTLIELLVVIAIIGILSGLIVVTMSGITQKASIAKGQIFANSLRNSLILNLVSEWKFDGPTADGVSATVNDVKDTWGGVNNGTVSFPPTVKTGSNCVSGSCLQFINTGSTLVDFDDNSSLSMGLGDATISFWVKFDYATSPQNETLVYTGCGGGTAGYPGYLIFRNTSRIYCYFSDGTAIRLGANLSPSGSLVGDTWYNIVVVFDRNVSLQVYINGIKQTTALDITPQQGNVQNITSLKVGATSSTANRLAGKMDEIKLYNAAMPTSQIKEQYYVGLNSLLANGGIAKEEYLSKIANSNSGYSEE